MLTQLVIAGVVLALVAWQAVPVARILSNFFATYPLLRHWTTSPAQAQMRPVFVRIAALVIFAAMCVNVLMHG